MRYGYEMAITDMIGETLTHIDIDAGKNEILLTTNRGVRIKIYHAQDCCESVVIHDTQGNWHDLVGKVIIEAGLAEDCKSPPPKDAEYVESHTWTTIKLSVDDATVISRWFGESNGYYSESVSIENVTKIYGARAE